MVGPLAACEERVLELVRGLARETGGARAEHAVAPGASLEREVGLGSLERVELLLRLERSFGRALDEGCLTLDTPAALARAVIEAGPSRRHTVPQPEAGPGPAREIGTEVRTLQESLWRHACLDPQRAHVLLRSDERTEEVISYGRLWEDSAAIAGGLLERGLRGRETVALMLPTGHEFLSSFMGVLEAGGVPVPLYPPARLEGLEEYLERQSMILADAGACLLLTEARIRPLLSRLRRAAPSLREILTAAELLASGPPLQEPRGAGEDPALIQYTSGSTGRPKGVLLHHDNLLANVRAIAGALALSPADVGVSWLPLYHDMGLIGSWLTCLHHGVPLTLLPPTSFLARPERWLWAIHQRRATLSPAPNFAYELCARRLPDEALEGLDLSSWRVALNGAEPVSPATLERFSRRFRPHGFRPEAMTPVYGLAECSVALAFPPLGRGPLVDRVARAAFESEARARPAAADDPGALEFVCVGRELAAHEIRIVDESGRDRGEREVGRLVFRGPSATDGYYKNPQATASISLPGGWLDSGDLAYRAGGEIYVCGRLKDLIIKGGRNLVPQEVEEAAATVTGVRRGCAVAFGVPNAELGTESLVLVAETRVGDRAERERLAGAVVARVAEAVGVPPDHVLLVEPGVVPKTSSGKLRRSATRELFLSGALAPPKRLSFAQRARLGGATAWERARSWAARARRGLYALWLAAALPPLLLLSWLLVVLVPSRRLAVAVSRLGSRLLLRLCGCRATLSGGERLPRSGGLVLAANHASYCDVAALLATLPVDFLFVAKRELLASRLVGPFLRRGGHLTVDRWEPRSGITGARAVAEALRAGERVLFCPEGTFVAATGLRPFRLGAFKAAAEAAVPVVPIALRGTRRVLRGDWSLPRPGQISVWIGEPIRPEGTDLAALLRLRDRAADAIATECGEPRLDLTAAGPLRPPSPEAEGRRTP